MNLNKSLIDSDGVTFRRQMIENLKIIEDTFNKVFGYKDLSTQERKELSEFKNALEKEIRAIVMPEMSPLEVTEEVSKSKIDLTGVKHETLSQRIDADINNIIKKDKYSNLVVTQNGTLVYDYSKLSQTIKQVRNIYCIGDSVARGLHAKKNYGQYLSEKLNIPVNNFAVSGATFSTASNNNIYKQANQIQNADLVIIQGTDDDWLYGNGVKIGKDKTDISTFYGAFYQIIKLIRLQNKGVKIICMTATRQLPVNGNQIRRKDTDKNSLGLTLEDYVNAQILACTELKIPVFDAYHSNIIDSYNPAFRDKCMVDGLHPNELVHEVITYELLKNYYYFYG